MFLACACVREFRMLVCGQLATRRPGRRNERTRGLWLMDEVRPGGEAVEETTLLISDTRSWRLSSSNQL
ncbi:hypothetical protein RRG08_059728 [Elysia crispata]|uniref:Uncharacterized protein n=1 Tax=Elysia crispata TaxID=231223 RepID=A0AAE0YNQ5_9GAST|nr:hypothetical protein RRG08_059728 [Elysia crispata]